MVILSKRKELRNKPEISKLLTIVILTVVFVSGIISCTKEEAPQIGAVKDRDKLPGLEATKITTVISDSGITRYRIYSDQWNIYDRGKDPYWDFPKGIYFEKFTPNLAIDANFRSDKARYDELKKIWEFKGKVKAINLKGEMFETDLLYWDQTTERIYSDKFIRVTQQTRIINAVGFESDQSLTKYRFRNVEGIMTVKETN